MARRMSNRDRISRMREEADATDREKGPVDTGRLRAVWAVKDGHGEVVATFPYARKSLAAAEAARLKDVNRRAYIVCQHKVPF